MGGGVQTNVLLKGACTDKEVPLGRRNSTGYSAQCIEVGPLTSTQPPTQRYCPDTTAPPGQSLATFTSALYGSSVVRPCILTGTTGHAYTVELS
jgi:hypothetical protein